MGFAGASVPKSRPSERRDAFKRGAEFFFVEYFLWREPDFSFRTAHRKNGREESETRYTMLNRVNDQLVPKDGKISAYREQESTRGARELRTVIFPISSLRAVCSVSTSARRTGSGARTATKCAQRVVRTWVQRSLAAQTLEAGTATFEHLFPPNYKRYQQQQQQQK